MARSVRPARDPKSGPWISGNDIHAFEAWCNGMGLLIRLPANFENGFRPPIEVRHDGHWMAVKWNNTTGRYTADRRLEELVVMFKDSQSKSH